MWDEEFGELLADISDRVYAAIRKEARAYMPKPTTRTSGPSPIGKRPKPSGKPRERRRKPR